MSRVSKSEVKREVTIILIDTDIEWMLEILKQYRYKCVDHVIGGGKADKLAEWLEVEMKT